VGSRVHNYKLSDDETFGGYVQNERKISLFAVANSYVREMVVVVIMMMMMKMTTTTTTTTTTVAD